MSVLIQRLAGPVQIANAATSYYTAAVATMLDKVTVSNPSASTAYTVVLYVVPNGSAVDTAHIIQPTLTLQPLDALDIDVLEGHNLNVGDQLYAVASVASELNLLVSGKTVS